MSDPAASPLRAFVATLVAPRGTNCLDLPRITHLRAALPGAETAILSPGRAIDLHVMARQAEDIEAALRPVLSGLPVDIIVQPSQNRRKKLFIADMDSTMIGQECIDELADAVGLKAHVSAITERAMRGEIAFEPALRERVALLKGLPSSIAGEMIGSRITLTPGGPELVRTMRRNGGYTALVSGGFTLFTGPIAALIGFDMHRSNTLLLADDKLTGMVADPILGKEAKRETLIELRGKLGITPADVMATGDGANDLAMLEEAGIGVAFHAKPVVAASAHARIDHTDLFTLLYAQGYRDEEIVSV